MVVLLAAAAWAAGGEKGAPRPPWEGQYKIRPDEKHRLTPADVVGPDGIVYPKWTKCGVQGGIPKVKAVARIEAFGGKANDELDDSAALDAACRRAGEKGGGAVVLGAGTYCLDRPVTVRHDGVVIRGAGRDKTKIIFRYAIPKAGLAFYWPPAGSRVGRETHIELHCRPKGLMKMTILAGGKTVKAWQRGRHSGNTFNTAGRGSVVVGKVPDGPARLRGVGVFARTCSFDHVIRGNVFVLKDGKSPMVHLATADCVGVEILDNRVYGGSGKFLAGPAAPAAMKGNKAAPQTGKLPPRPKPAVASIYEWQKANGK